MKTLYIGETNSRDSKYYYELDESAFNLTVGNHKQGLEQKRSGVFYTSVTDFQNEHYPMLQACNRFDKIICQPPATWTTSLVKRQTEEFLKLLSLFKPIDNFIIDSTQRKTKNPQIWIAGCSWSSAVGVTYEQNWGSLVAKKLNMPVSFLAKPGTGNSYQAKRLLSADINENDIVIFQVTTPYRETILDPAGYGIVHVHPGSYNSSSSLYKTYSPDRLDELTLIINQITDIQNVVNFLQKIKAKFLIWSPGAPLITEELLTMYICNTKYCYLYPNPVPMADLGTDGAHPGPKTHKQYAEFVFKKLKLQEEQA